MLQPGTYNARALEAVLGLTKSKKEQVGVQFEIIDGPAQGTLITWYGYFTHKTLDRTLESLEACGWDGITLDDLSKVGSKQCSIVVEHERDEQTGEPRARVRWVNGSGVAMKDRMTAEQARSFAEHINNIRRNGEAPQQHQPRRNYDFGNR